MTSYVAVTDILVLAETHIRPTDTDGLHNSLTPASYNFIQNRSLLDWAVLLVSCAEKPSLPVLSLHWLLDHSKASYSIFAACLYRPPGSFTTQFFKDFLVLSGLLSSICSDFIICRDINVHLDVECGDRSRFSDIF